MSLTDSKRTKSYINKYDKNVKVASSSKPFSISNYNSWKKRYESGASMKDLPKEITHGDLKLYLKLYKKKN
jgi:hypothetical protein